MKRSEFLKRLGLGVVILPLVPKIAAEVADIVQKEAVTKVPLPDDYVEIGEVFPGRAIHFDGVTDFVELTDTPEEYYPPMQEMSIHEELYKRYGGRDIREIIEIYRETDNLIY